MEQRQNIESYKLGVERHFEFVFGEEVETSEARILVPMKLVCPSFFGLVFVDTNDSTVYKFRNIRLQRNIQLHGVLNEINTTSDEMILVGYVDIMSSEKHTFFYKAT
jgi:hypothetical protein